MEDARNGRSEEREEVEGNMRGREEGKVKVVIGREAPNRKEIETGRGRDRKRAEERERGRERK